MKVENISEKQKTHNGSEEKVKELLEEIEKLKRKIKILKSKKKYGLVWEEEKEPEQIVLDCQYKIPLLKEVSEKKIITDKKKPMNILIEGDNYHALSVLNYTHKEKIDVIYIDPPYNTGNKDFIFNDRYVDKEDSYRHSKWLSFMEKRLKLAKNLLKNTGVIFISIDDNEVAQLKMLMDSPDLFGGNNIGVFVWRKKAGAGADSKLLFTQHEYVLFYARNINQLTNFFEPLNKKQLKEYKNPDNDPRGLWAPTDLTAPSSDTDNSRLYEMISPTGKKWFRRWSYTKDNMKNLVKDRLVWFGKDGDSMPKRKRFLSEKQGLVPRSLIDFVLTQNGKRDFENIFGKDSRLFEYPKPVLLIKHLLRIASKKNSIILDFMAGSGTTGHAVLELNKEDGSNRKFILCTNNENNNGNSYKIAEDICYPRIKKVIEGYKNLKGEKVEGLGGNLRYFKTELLDVDHISHVSDEQKIMLTYKAGEMIALREDTFEEIERNEWWQIFKNETKYTAIYFEEDKKKLNELVEKLGKLKEKVALYIFSWGKNEYKNEFTEYKNIKVDDIPEPIIDVYKEINRLEVII